jgi:type VI secretion system secreted protein VgrG
MLTDFRSLTVTQELFTHHTFAIDFSFEALARALEISPDLLFKQGHELLSGELVTISWVSALPLSADGQFEFKGIVTETSIQTHSDLSNYYHISGASPTFVMEDGSQSRSFVKQTVAQIFTTVLGQYEDNVFERQLKPRRQAVLPYVAQYDETNFNFLSRLAAQQGEWFYYDGTKLHLGLAEKPAVAFQSSGVQGFTLSMNLQPGQLKGSFYNYRTHQPLQATASAPAGADAFSEFALQRSKKVFKQPHRLLADSVLTDTTKLQTAMDVLAAKQTSGLVSLEGHGEIITLSPGSLLEVRDAAGVDYGQFRVLAVSHELDGDGNYQNNFKGMSGALASPPANEFYAAPAAHPEIAEVIDLADPRRLGRVRVRFQWLVEKKEQAESGWLRVTTPYSGDGKGHLFTPEVGSQVLVNYEHGLPDMPVVVGNVFHPQNKQGAKYSPPNNHLKGFQTAGGNKFILDDAPEAKVIRISNSGKKGTSVELSFKDNGSITIKSEGPVQVLSPAITLEAGAKGEINLHAKNITIDADENLKLLSGTKTEATTQEMSLYATQSLSMEGSTTATLSGGQVIVTGDTTTHVKAPIVNIN